MVKKIISLSISEESLDRADLRSKALGLSRSEFFDQMIKNGWNFSNELDEVVDAIISLQSDLNVNLEEEKNEA